MTQNLLWWWLIAFREVNRYGRNFTTAEAGILFSIATRASGNGTGIHPGTARVCADMGASERTVAKALKSARNQNVMARVRQGRRGTGEADEYALVPPSSWRLRFDSEHRESDLPY